MEECILDKHERRKRGFFLPILAPKKSVKKLFSDCCPKHRIVLALVTANIHQHAKQDKPAHV